jgi:hypothetical protein
MVKATEDLQRQPERKKPRKTIESVRRTIGEAERGNRTDLRETGGDIAVLRGLGTGLQEENAHKSNPSDRIAPDRKPKPEQPAGSIAGLLGASLSDLQPPSRQLRGPDRLCWWRW